MPPPVVAALLAALASLVVALFSAAYTRRNTLDVERLKRRLDVASDEVKGTLQFLKDANGGIQQFRDALRMIVSAPEGTLSPEAAVAELRAAANKYEEVYRGSVGTLDAETSSLTHLAKSVMFGCVQQAQGGLDSDRLENVRHDLQVLQSELLALRMEHLSRYGEGAP